MAESNLRDRVLALPDEERLELLDAIVTSFDDGFELHPAWRNELRTRRDACEAGEVDMVPGDEFAAELKHHASGE